MFAQSISAEPYAKHAWENSATAEGTRFAGILGLENRPPRLSNYAPPRVSVNPSMASSRHPLGVRALIPIQFLLSVLSIPSGALLLYSPGGNLIGAQTLLPHLTQRIPFLHDFAPVGLFLVVVYGLVPIVLALGLWSRMRLAWILALVLGVTEIAWITAEVVLFYDLGFFIFYPIIAGMGLVTLVLGLLPSVRAYYDFQAGRRYSVALPASRKGE